MLGEAVLEKRLRPELLAIMAKHQSPFVVPTTTLRYLPHTAQLARLAGTQEATPFLEL